MKNLVQLVCLSDISHIHLICDHDPDGVSIGHWFEVSLEIPQNNHVQTLAFTVSYGPDEDPYRFLEETLAAMGWTWERDDIYAAHQGCGYEGRTVMKNRFELA